MRKILMRQTLTITTITTAAATTAAHNCTQQESIRDNFVIIYELLDETMDFGYPQTMESKILREYITQEGNRLEAAPRPPVALTNAVSWRSEGIRHRKNEIFLDVSCCATVCYCLL
jgi:hypothetical protein